MRTLPTIRFREIKCLMRCDIEYSFSWYVNLLEDAANLFEVSALPFSELRLRIKSEDPCKQGCGRKGGVRAFAWG
jgi:hypothetical protein